MSLFPVGWPLPLIMGLKSMSFRCILQKQVFAKSSWALGRIIFMTVNHNLFAIMQRYRYSNAEKPNPGKNVKRLRISVLRLKCSSLKIVVFSLKKSILIAFWATFNHESKNAFWRKCGYTDSGQSWTVVFREFIRCVLTSHKFSMDTDTKTECIILLWC